MGATSQDDPRVIAAVETICEVGKRHGKCVGMFLSRPADVSILRAKGASLFLLGSDQGFMLAGAADLLARTGHLASARSFSTVCSPTGPFLAPTKLYECKTLRHSIYNVER
jgi:hypothetical protein